MARNPVVQVACEPGLYKKIGDYQKEKGIQSKAEAVRELVDFAFRVLEHAAEDDAVTTREILEEILLIQSKSWNLQNNIYFQTFDEEKYSVDLTPALNRKKVAVGKAEEFVEGFLSGGEKKGA